MFEKIKHYFLNYFKKRKPFAIITDILFWGLHRNSVTKYQILPASSGWFDLELSKMKRIESLVL